MKTSDLSTYSFRGTETTWTEVYTGGPPEEQEFVTLPWYPYLLVVTYILVVLGLPGNVLTISAFCKFPQLQTPTNFLICSQSFADILFILAAQFLLMTQFTSTGLQLVSQNKYACLASLWASAFSQFISLLNLFFLSLERLIAGVWSLEYFTLITEQLVKKTIILSWIASLTITSLPFFGLNDWQPGYECAMYNAYPAILVLVILLIASTLLLLVTIINITICYIAARKKSVKPSPSFPICCSNDFKGFPKSTGASNYKITKMFLMMAGVFYLSLLPFILVSIVNIFQPIQSWMIEGKPDWFLFLHDISKCFLVLNGLCNPFIYAKRNKKFKVAFMRILGFDPSSIIHAE